MPTVWQMLLTHLRATGGKLTTLRRGVIGGAALPESILRAFQDDYGVEVAHGRGMTELSPGVALAAVIGTAHPKWDERPLLVVALRPDMQATKAQLLAHLDGKIARWWMPDDVVFLDEVPLGATGKIDKRLLRERLQGYELPTVN